MIIWSIHGIKTSNATTTAIILGIKTSVISLICVAVWNILTSTPATKPASKQGAAKKIAVFKASVKIPVTNSGVIFFYLKLFTKEPAIKYQPSTSVNNINLKGNEIITGGSIIIPIERRTLATTISMIKKGM